MTAIDDKLIISKELANKLKINEDTLAEKIGAIVSPTILKQIEKLRVASNKEKAPSIQSEPSATLFEPKQDSIPKLSTVLEKITSFGESLVENFNNASESFKDIKESASQQVGSKLEAGKQIGTVVADKSKEVGTNVLNKIVDVTTILKEKFNEKTLSERIEKVVSPTFKKQIEKIKESFSEKNEKGPETTNSFFKIFGKQIEKIKESFSEKTAPTSESLTENNKPANNSSPKLLPLLIESVRTLTEKTESKESNNEKTLTKEKSPSLFETLVKNVTLLTKSISPKQPQSLLETEKESQNVIVTSFSQQALDALSSFLPEVITKGTVQISETLNQINEKFDKLLELVKTISQNTDNIDGGGSILDMLPFGRRGARGPRPGRRGRNRRGGKANKGGKAGKPTPTGSKPTKGSKPSTPKPAGGEAGKKAGKGAGRTAAKGAGKIAGTALKGAGAVGAVLGAGLEFASRKEEGQTNLQAGAGTAGTAAGAGLGAWGGAATGAAIGSIIPGAGTVIGGVIGGLIGGIGGAFAGGAAADAATGVNRDRIINQWKEDNIASDKKGGEYVFTYDNLPEDKKKEIDKILINGYEKDPFQTQQQANKKLEEFNPKLIYGDKIAPELTETLDKNLPSITASSPTSPQQTGSKQAPTDNTPTITISKPGVGSRATEATTSEIAKNPEKALTQIQPGSQTKIIEGEKPIQLSPSLTNVISQPGKPSIETPFSMGLQGTQEKTPEKPLPQDEETYEEDQEYPNQVPNTPIFLPPTNPSANVQQNPKVVTAGISGETIKSIQNQFPGASNNLSKIGKTALTALMPTGLGLAAGASAIKNGFSGMKSLFSPKPETTQTAAAAQQPSPIGLGIQPSQEQTTEPTSLIKPAQTNTTTTSISQTAADTISSSLSLNDGLLKEIAENTKKTNEEVGRLADNFTVFSKMLPGALSNNSRSSESQPIIVNKNSKAGMGNKIRSAQIAKSGNPEIQNFRTIVENNRQMPA